MGCTSISLYMSMINPIPSSIWCTDLFEATLGLSPMSPPQIQHGLWIQEWQYKSPLRVQYPEVWEIMSHANSTSYIDSIPLSLRETRSGPKPFMEKSSQTKTHAIFQYRHYSKGLPSLRNQYQMIHHKGPLQDSSENLAGLSRMRIW